ncbi:RepB family plasmid replication initiator protein [Ruminococcus flavefaciens]|uniref:Initiator Rep protein WH1 domain-containing protein n=1 Tax=Ruminococcus flavefaciens 007c TaxID=1341157 RepID=W7UUY0_RUMFL|nr:RepB family plasmid replication initiator protein [Ruminococcus flavefaciens]EWM54974.1 hypothetical protein RF007C_02985 [Ruminococcus flavefaciens 007c]
MAYEKGIDGISSSVGKVLETSLQVNSVSRNAFRIMKQSSAMNKLSTLKVTKKTVEDTEDGTICIEKDNLKLSFAHISDLGSGLKTTTHRLADALMIKFTEMGSKEQSVSLSLDEYMRMCELKNTTEMRKQVNSDLKTLLNMRVSFQKSSNREQSMQDIKLCSDVKIKNNIIFFTFSPEFFIIMKTMPVMHYPEKLFRINLKKNPNSYYFLKKIAEHKKMNYFKKNADTLSVKTLLSCTPELPSYEEVVNSDRAVGRRIIEPFERDMNELSDILRWEYCHSNGTRLTDEELENFNYHIFYGLLVKIKWYSYPELKRKKNKAVKSK